MTESATHSPTPWRKALDRLHYNARCNENRWHDAPVNADRDKEAVFLAHDEMVEALTALNSALESNCDLPFSIKARKALGEDGVAAWLRVRSLLSKSNPTQKGE